MLKGDGTITFLLKPSVRIATSIMLSLIHI